MPYKDAEKQKEAQRDWVRRKRIAEQGSTTIIDAVGKSHKIDFAGRRRDRELLARWAAGNGTTYQQSLGTLAEQYRVIEAAKK